MNRSSAGRPPFRKTRPNANAGLERSRLDYAEKVAWCATHLPDLPSVWAVSALSMELYRHGRGNVTVAMVRERAYALRPELRAAA